MQTNPFRVLNPEFVLQACEQAGFQPTGELTQLNSYENRVFEIGDEVSSKIIGKFYRPLRWNESVIAEEHEFLQDLKREGLLTIAPLVQKNSLSINTLGKKDSLYFAFFEKASGRMPQEFSLQNLKQIGRSLALLHNVGAQKKFKHRVTLNTDTFGWQSLDLLEKWVAPEMWSRYSSAAKEILWFLDDELEHFDFQRIHGDCHRGNLLELEKNFYFVDFDDCCTGPAVQDFWMLFSSTNVDEESAELDAILEGYLELRDWDEREMILVPALRALRIIHYAAWIARRWTDPSFPKLFPLYGSNNYWAEETEAIERIAWQL